MKFLVSSFQLLFGYLRFDFKVDPLNIVLDIFSDGKVPPKYFQSPGLLHNTNTIETFKNCDKKKMIDSIGQEVGKAILVKSKNDKVGKNLVCNKN